MLGSSRLKFHASPPSLAQGIGGGAHHAGQIPNPVKLAQYRSWQDALDGFLQRFFVYWLSQATREPRSKSLEGQYLKAMSAFAGPSKSMLSYRHATMRNYRMSPGVLHLFHLPN